MEMTYDQAKREVLATLVPAPGSWFWKGGPHSQLIKVVGDTFWRDAEKEVRIPVELYNPDDTIKVTGSGWMFLVELWTNEPTWV